MPRFSACMEVHDPRNEPRDAYTHRAPDDELSERLRSLEVQDGEDRKTEFGWYRMRDQVNGSIYYVHSYTGEAVPATSSARYPPKSEQEHLTPFHGPSVMLSMGVMPIHPRTFAFDSSAGGYGKFPLYRSSQGIAQGCGVPFADVEDVMLPGYRLLPSTWERSTYGPPFYPSFPVAALHIVPLPTELCDSNGHRAPLLTSGHQHRSSPPHHSEPHSIYTNTGPPQDLHSGASPRIVYKEHNRRGYTMRQTRKLMKELGLTAPKPKKPNCHLNQRTTHSQHHELYAPYQPTPNYPPSYAPNYAMSYYPPPRTIHAK